MARQGRLHVPNETYYVRDALSQELEVLVPRAGQPHTGAELRHIAAHRIQFESQLHAVTRRWGATVHAHCWLPNKALLLIGVSCVPLDVILHSLHGNFSRYLHRNAGITGRPYPARYHAMVIDAEEFLLDFAREIFLAPVAARLCEDPLAYEHSALHAWAGGPTPLFLRQSALRRAFAQRGIRTPIDLGTFLKQPPRFGFQAFLRRGSSSDRRIAGNLLFVRKVRAKSEHVRSVSRLSSTEPVLRWVTQYLGIDGEDDPGKRQGEIRELTRALAAWLITCCGSVSLSQVARWFQCGKSTLHTHIKQHCEQYPEVFNSHTFAKFGAFLETLNLLEPVRPTANRPTPQEQPRSPPVS